MLMSQSGFKYLPQNEQKIIQKSASVTGSTDLKDKNADGLTEKTLIGL